jgi:histidine triad (HIT) family protein
MPDNQSSLFGPKEQVCAFCQIAKKEKDAYIVFEDQNTIGFLDSRPLFPGHVLLVPKSHYSQISQIPDEMIGKLFSNTKRLSIAVEKGLGSEGTFIAVNNKVSQSIPHLHIHIVPRKAKDGLKGFFWPRYKYQSNEEIIQSTKENHRSFKRIINKVI